MVRRMIAISLGRQNTTEHNRFYDKDEIQMHPGSVDLNVSKPTNNVFKNQLITYLL